MTILNLVHSCIYCLGVLESFLIMKEDTDIDRAIGQHIEMESFFSGGTSLRSDNVEKPIDSAKELESIAVEVKACRACELGESRTNAVPGQGNTNARIVFVGEAPGADEDAKGLAFIGRAGQLLTKIIEAMGISREEVFICNILKCRPPGNRDPKPDEIISCLPFLQRQLELIGPEVIVALGAHAAKTLLNTKSAIGQLRGRFHDYYTSEEAEPIKLMPTYSSGVSFAKLFSG